MTAPRTFPSVQQHHGAIWDALAAGARLTGHLCDGDHDAARCVATNALAQLNLAGYVVVPDGAALSAVDGEDGGLFCYWCKSEADHESDDCPVEQPRPKAQGRGASRSVALRSGRSSTATGGCSTSVHCPRCSSRGGCAAVRDERRGQCAMTASTLLTLPDGEALRDHLDALNEAGEHPVAVGLTVLGHPFLITLVGIYAEGEDVLFDSPWQHDIDYGKRVDGMWVPQPPRCDECNAHVHGIEDVHFPVTVMVPAERDPESLHEPVDGCVHTDGLCYRDAVAPPVESTSTAPPPDPSSSPVTASDSSRGGPALREHGAHEKPDPSPSDSEGRR